MCMYIHTHVEVSYAKHCLVNLVCLWLTAGAPGPALDGLCSSWRVGSLVFSLSASVFMLLAVWKTDYCLYSSTLCSGDPVAPFSTQSWSSLFSADSRQLLLRMCVHLSRGNHSHGLYSYDCYKRSVVKTAQKATVNSQSMLRSTENHRRSANLGRVTPEVKGRKAAQSNRLLGLVKVLTYGHIVTIESMGVTPLDHTHCKAPCKAMSVNNSWPSVIYRIQIPTYSHLRVNLSVILTYALCCESDMHTYLLFITVLGFCQWRRLLRRLSKWA